jgi:tRNA1(Val) A37 N6-methylase TrmN6
VSLVEEISQRSRRLVEDEDLRRAMGIASRKIMEEAFTYNQAAILKRLAHGGVFIDVGANIGGYTIRVAKTARAYALEPHPRNFHLLKLNVKLNQKQDNVRAFQVAAGSSLCKGPCKNPTNKE